MNLIPKAASCIIEVSAPNNTMQCLTVEGPSLSQTTASDGVSKVRRLDLWFDHSSILSGSTDLLELHQQQGLRFSLHTPTLDVYGKLLEVQQIKLPTTTLIMLQFELLPPCQERTGLFSWLASFWPGSTTVIDHRVGRVNIG